MGGPSHIVVDWGTSRLRLWALDPSGRVLAERRSGQGLAAAAAEGFETVLESHLSALGVPARVPVMMCGMVGSRQGWAEAGYLTAPTRLERLAEEAIAAPAHRREARILPGIAQRDAGTPDVMRGEETQLLALCGEGRVGLVCLPGTHSKWVVLEGGEIRRFATFMTGELFQLLQANSVLAPAVAGARPVDAADPAFAAGVADALAAPEMAGNRLFEVRAGWLLADPGATASLAKLSGLLIGLELAGARRCMGGLGSVTLVASGPLASLYQRALVVAGVDDLVTRDAEACVREGLHAAAGLVFELQECCR